MSREIRAEIANMCVIQNGTKVLVEDRRDPKDRKSVV